MAKIDKKEVRKESGSPEKEPELFFRYREARIIVMSSNTITYRSKNVSGKEEDHWCFYELKSKKMIEEAIKSDGRVNILIARYFLPDTNKDSETKYRTEDWLHQIWRIMSPT